MQTNRVRIHVLIETGGSYDSGFSNLSLPHPCLRELHLSVRELSTEQLKSFLPGLRSVQALTIRVCQPLHSYVLRDIGEHCPNLTYLSFRAAHEFDDSDISSFVQHCTAIKRLQLRSISGSQLTDRSLLAVAACCSSLERLDLLGWSFDRGVHITEYGLLHLIHRCTNIKRLRLACADISLSALEHMGEVCTALRALDIKSDISDEGLRVIAQGFPNLKKFSLSSRMASEFRLFEMRPGIWQYHSFCF